MPDKTLVIVKPDHEHLAEEILKKLDKHAKRIKTARIDKVPKEIVEEHYSIHKEKDFYERLINSFKDRRVVVVVYEGNNIIKKFIEIIGNTDPSKAAKGTIRKEFSDDSIDVAISEGRAVKNVIHRSDSSAEFEREMKVWEKFF